MDRLRILLLGTPVIYLGDKPVPIRRRIQRVLLSYLAAQGDLVSRTQLAALFWPEESEDLARRHLREALSKLRSYLPDPDALITVSSRVGLDPEKVYVDSLEFLKLFDQVGRMPWQIQSSTPLPAGLYQTLVQAIRLWRSPRFMAGVTLPPSGELDDWLNRTGLHLQNARLRILERLAEHANASGDPEGALNWLRSALEEDELNENLHYRVLEILAVLGRRSEALQYFDYLQGLFRRELNDSPSEAILRLAEKIQQAAPEPPPVNRSSWPDSLSMQVPFVGRENALNELKQAFHRGGLAVIYGEAGAGKSRLVQELYYSLKPAARLLLAPSRPQENTLPFQPLIEMLRHSVSPQEWSRLSPVWTGPLSILLPELLLTGPDITPTRPEAPEQARALLFEAIHQLLIQLAEDQPILLCLDDAQWADEASLAALAYLAERLFFEDHGLLVIAARPEENNPYLDDLLTSLHASPLFLQVDLEQLSTGEVADLARYTLGQVPPDEFTRRLVQDTGGNPLFVLETLRAVLELIPGPDRTQMPANLPLAGSIHTLVRSRLRQLNPQTSQVLVAAAVVGNAFDLDVLETASRLEPEQVVQALEELERAHLVRPAPAHNNSGTGYHFIHEKIREVILLDMSPARHRLLHRRVGKALEEKFGAGPGRQASVLAQHFESGGDLLAAFRYWIQAGQRARQLFSTQEAYACYRRAEHLLPSLHSSPNEDLLYALYTGWGELAEENGDAETMSQAYHRLHHMGEQIHSHFLVGTALSGLGSAALVDKRLTEGLPSIDRAIPYLERSGSLFEHMQAYIRRGTCLLWMSRYEEAIASYEKALALGRDSQHLAVEQACVDALDQLAIAFARSGQPERGREYAEQALRQSTWPVPSSSQVWTYIALAFTHHETGRFDQVNNYALRGIELAEQIQSWHAAGHLHVTAARSNLLAGNLDECWMHLEAAGEFSERSGRDGLHSEVMGTRGDLFWCLEDYPRALDAYQAGTEAFPDSFEGMDCRHCLGTIVGLMGDIERGLEIIDQSIAYARAVGAHLIRLPAEINRCVLLMARGEYLPAMDHLRRIQAEAIERRMAPTQLIATGRMARIMQLSGQTGEALASAREMIHLAQEIQAVWLEIWGHRLALSALAQTGEPDTVHRESIRLIVNRLDSQATTEPLRSFFLRYRQRLLPEFHQAE